MLLFTKMINRIKSILTTDLDSEIWTSVEWTKWNHLLVNWASGDDFYRRIAFRCQIRSFKIRWKWVGRDLLAVSLATTSSATITTAHAALSTSVTAALLG